MKKHVLFLFATLLSLAASAHHFEVDGIYYNFISETDKTVEVTYRGATYTSYINEYSGSINIPSTVTHNGVRYSVTSIGNYAFSSCNRLTAITIPEGVTSIGDDAFRGCSSLERVTINCANVGSWFSELYSLKEIELGESVTSIGDDAFYWCTSLTSITIPEDSKLTSIGRNAFYYCSSLKSITIPEGVTSIGESAFGGCSSLERVTINCANVGSWFSGLSSLKEIELGESVTSIGDDAFERCSSLTSITIPESVTSIGNYAFRGCESLTTINIPESVTSIGKSAFYGCSSLTAITIPESVTSIGESAFGGCSSLERVTINCANVGSWFSSWFSKPSSLKEIVLGEGVTSIGDYAFEYCSSLTAITLPKGVTSIGDRAFYDCSSLTTINIPEDSKLTSIGKSAFDGCESLTAVHISSLEVWCNIDFANYSANPLYSAKNLYLNGDLVTELTIPNSVTAIKNYAFYGWSSLTAINIPEGVTSIGDVAFDGCTSLTAINIPEDSKLTSIGSSAFWGCSSLTAINIPESVTSIGDNAFRDCSSLTTITIPEGVTSIGDNAFRDCSSLTAITIPEGVTSIGENAFSYCSSLKTVINYSDLPLQRGSNDYGKVAYYADRVINADEVIDGYVFKTIEGVHYLTGYIGDKTELTLPADYKGENYQIGERAFYKCSSLTAITIPEDSKLTSIGGSAFLYCSSLTAVHINSLEVWCNIDFASSSANPLSSAKNLYLNGSLVTELTIPNSVTAIKNYAFSYYSSLTTITIPEGVTSIGSEAFSYCSSLTTINIPEGVTSIGEDAFSYCSSLTAINIPESVTSIGESAFLYCSSLTAVHISSLEVWCNIDFADSYANPLSSAKNLYLNGGLVTELTIPNSVTAIKSYAFRGCSSLSAITISEGVTSIGNYAFYGCSSLTAITLPEGVTSIGEDAFNGCSSLERVTINCANVGSWFSGLSSLKEVVLGEGVTSIGDHAFSWCSRLAAITLPESVTSIGSHAFYSCRSLKSITIPEGVTSIGGSAFSGCSSLESITIPEGVTSIGGSVFYGCSSLTTVVLPKSVKDIYSNAFANCPELTDVYCYAETVPTTNTNAFNGSDIEHATLHVPASAINSYRSAAPWSGFGTIIALGASITEITLSESSATLTEGEDLTLTMTTNPENADRNLISWSSSNPSVATVDRGGKVTAIAPGTATITATANDGSGVSAQCEVTVTPASYVITFLVDGEVILTNTLTRGSTINLPDVPEKEGYTFSGWSEVPETMPAKDVTVSGTFIVNKYLVTFKIGDEVIAANSFEYGAAIVAPKAPAKEGYTFSGWSEVPETMPAKNVTVSGTFIINKYLVTFKIDDVVFASYSLEYGATITLPSTPPTREGYTFSGWGEVAETVPANDVTYSAYYIANVYKVYYFAEDKLVNMVEVTYGEPIPEYIYEPTTEGDEFLGWIGETYATMPAHDVTYTANISSDINAMSMDKGQQTIVIYDTTGRKVTDTKNLKGGIYIINGRKVMIK